MTDFTITAVPAGGTQVAWEDAENDYWFTAEFDDDTLVRIRPGGIGRKNPTIYKRLKGGGRGSFSYHPVDDFAEIVQEAAALISRDHLASTARARQIAERAQREAEWIREKAAKARYLMEKHGLRVPVARDDQFAAFYDDVQDAVV